MESVTVQGFGYVGLIAVIAVVLLFVGVWVFWRRSSQGLRPMVASGGLLALEHNQRVALCTEGKFGELFIDTENDCLYTVTDVEHMGTMRLEFSLIGCFDFDFLAVPSKAGGKSQFKHGKNLRREVLMTQMGKVVELGRNWDRFWPAVYEAIMNRRQDYDATMVPTAKNATLTFEMPEDAESGEHQENQVLSLKLSPFDGFWGVAFSLDGTIHDAYVVY